MERVSCRGGAKSQTQSVANYKVRLVQVPEKATDDYECRAYLQAPTEPARLLLQDTEISMYKGTGEDVFNSGHATLILEGFSGGAHCCYTYSLTDLGDRPTTLPSVENQSPFFFFKDASDGRFRIRTSDGAFDYFDGMCHACTPFPTVVLEIRNGRIEDASSRYLADYDAEIASAKSEVNQGDLGRFLTVPDLPTNGQAQSEFEDLRRQVLTIVFAYLYTGREAQAWKTLDDMWPASDRTRIKKLILDTKSDGILVHLNEKETRSTSVK